MAAAHHFLEIVIWSIHSYFDDIQGEMIIANSISHISPHSADGRSNGQRTKLRSLYL